MVVPAMQLASKIPDMSVQLWSSALLRGKSGTNPGLGAAWESGKRPGQGGESRESLGMGSPRGGLVSIKTGIEPLGDWE